MSPALSGSALEVQGSRIRELAEIAMTMPGVYRLYFGESNQPTPAFLQQAAMRAIGEGRTFYTGNAGIPELRSALARYYSRMHGVALDPGREIIVTAGGVQALNVAIRCVLDPGDEAIVLTPAWPNGSAIVQLANAVPRQAAQPLCGSRYTVDFDELARTVTPRTRLLAYTSPSNPLGWVATEDEQRGLLEFARRHGLWLLADEVYERLGYRGEPGGAVPSILRMATRGDAVIAVQSFSKSYCMTGWRLGWLVARADLAERAARLNEFIISCTPEFVQRAGIAAIEEGEPFIAGLVTRLKQNRDYCLSRLRGMPGVTVPEPDGAFYLFPRVEGIADSFDFCKRLLMETGVGLAPGVAFGAGGEGSVRLCYAADRSILEPAMDLLNGFLRP